MEERNGMTPRSLMRNCVRPTLLRPPIDWGTTTLMYITTSSTSRHTTTSHRSFGHYCPRWGTLACRYHYAMYHALDIMYTRMVCTNQC